MRIISIFLAVYLFAGGLFPGMDFTQMARTSSLYRHYQDHRLESPESQADLPLVRFLWMHFLQLDSHQHPQGGGHADLPFQQINTDLQLFTASYPVLEPVASPADNRSLPSFQKAYLSRDWRDSVFHPPA